MGRTAPVYIISAQPDGSPTSQRVDVSDRIKSLSYEDLEKGPDKLSLTVNNWDYSNFSNPIFRQGCVLTVQWGYSDGVMSPQRKCTVIKVTGGAELKVEARGDAYLLNTVQKSRKFNQMKRSDVAQQIAKEQGYDAAHQFIEDTAVVLSQVTQAKMSDAALLRDLAKKEGFEWWIDYQGFHFHRRDLGQKPRRLFTYFTDPGAGDILAPPNVENDLTAKPGQVTAKGIDSKTGKPIQAVGNNTSDKGREGLSYGVDINPQTENRNVGPTVAAYNAELAKQAKNKIGVEATTGTTAKSQAEAQRHVDGAYRKIQLTAAIVTFPSVGDPLFEAKTVLTLGGPVGALAGNYYCTKVKHDLGQDYKMIVTCRRDSSGNATAVKSTASVNNGKADASSGGDTQLTMFKVPNPKDNQTRVVFLPKGQTPKTNPGG